MASSAMIDIDPYHRSQKNPQCQQKGGAQVSAIDFSAGRGSSGVDLHWYHPEEFKALPNDQKDELVKWHKSQEEKIVLDKSREAASKKHKADVSGGSKGKCGDSTIYHRAWK